VDGGGGAWPAAGGVLPADGAAPNRWACPGRAPPILLAAVVDGSVASAAPGGAAAAGGAAAH